MLDLVIIGGSSAGAAAGIYAARRGLKFKLITKDFNGELAVSGEIGNWPGTIKTDGIELAGKFREHLESYKIDMEEGIEVTKIEKSAEGSFRINDGVYEARTVIIATGAHPRELNIPGEKEFRNKGVSYCTVCDGPVFAGKVCATIGGGNSALESALMLADICSKVYVINKNAEFKGDTVLLDNLKTKPNVEIIYSAMTKEIIGKDFVTGLSYTITPKTYNLSVDGIFVHIGMIPNASMTPADVKKNPFGEIEVNANCETNIPGLYAAGDVTNVPFKQNAIAAGQGTIALLSAVSYLNRIAK